MEIWRSENNYFLGVKHVSATVGIYIKGAFWPGSFLYGTGMERRERGQLGGAQTFLSCLGEGREVISQDKVCNFEGLQSCLP